MNIFFNNLYQYCIKISLYAYSEIPPNLYFIYIKKIPSLCEVKMNFSLWKTILIVFIKD